MRKLKLKPKDIVYLQQFTKNGKKKAEIIASACTTPPEGRKRWTVRLLAEEMKKQRGFKTINRESIRLTLKKATLNLGKERKKILPTI